MAKIPSKGILPRSKDFPNFYHFVVVTNVDIKGIVKANYNDECVALPYRKISISIYVGVLRLK